MEKSWKKRLTPAPPTRDNMAAWLLARALRIFFLFGAVFLGAGLLFKDQLIFQPSSERFYSPEQFGLNHEEVELRSAGGERLKALIIARDTLNPGPSILAFTGNSGNVSLLLDRLSYLHALGVSVLAVDYPGYGQSSGQPGEEGLYQAAEALWRLALDRGVKPEEIIVYGFSLGGGVASHLAQARSPRALILDSTFTRLRDVPAHDLPLLSPLTRLVLGDAFDTNTRLKDIHCPLLILHSPDDEVVAYELGRRNYDSYINDRKELVRGQGGHMDFLLNHLTYGPRIKELLNLILIEEKNQEMPENADKAG